MREKMGARSLFTGAADAAGFGAAWAAGVAGACADGIAGAAGLPGAAWLICARTALGLAGAICAVMGCTRIAMIPATISMKYRNRIVALVPSYWTLGLAGADVG